MQTYYFFCQLNNAQNFLIFIKERDFSAEKLTWLKKNLKSVVLDRYQNFLDVILKKHLNIVVFYTK